MKKNIIISILLIVLLEGCNLGSNLNNGQVPIVYNSPNPTPTSLPTSTPNPTNSNTPTPSPIVTPSPNPTSNPNDFLSLYGKKFTYAYISDSDPNSNTPVVEKCNLDTTGLSNCMSESNVFNITSYAYGTTISNSGQYAYVITNTNLIKCSVEQNSGEFSNCVSEIISISGGRKVAFSFNDKTLYINNMFPNYGINVCSLNESYDITNCSLYTDPNFTGNLERLVISPDNSFLLFNSYGIVFECGLDINQNITSCQAKSLHFPSNDTLGISISLNKKYVYISQTNNGQTGNDITRCDYQPYGTFLTNCMDAFSINFYPNYLVTNPRYSAYYQTPYGFSLTTDVSYGRVFSCSDNDLIDGSTCISESINSPKPEDITTN